MLETGARYNQMRVTNKSVNNRTLRRARVLSLGATAALSVGTPAEAVGVELCAPVRRIVTIHSGSLRELLFSLPALRALRETFEGAHLCAVVREGLAPLLVLCPIVDEVLMRPEGGLSSHAPLMAKLHARHCDVAIAFSTSRNGTLLALASGAHVRLGFDGAKMDALLTHRVARASDDSTPSTLFAIDDYLDIARALGCAPRCHDYCDLIEPSVEGERTTARWLRDQNVESEWIALAPQRETRGGKVARDEAAYWARVAFLLSQRAPVVICGLRANRLLLAAARQHSNGGPPAKIFDAGGVLDFPSTAALFRGARLFAGPQSGVMHLAAAVRTPVVAQRLEIQKGDDAQNHQLHDEPRGVPHRIVSAGATPETFVQAARELIGL
jgi:ADP-heptose:LPS heptosyltransferase